MDVDGRLRLFNCHSNGNIEGDAATSIPAFLSIYLREYKPRLGCRAETFEKIFKYLLSLKKTEYLIVETGCVRQMNDWSAGQSTILFDSFVNECGGRLISVDNSPENCAHAKRRCTTQTEIVTKDSVAFLAEFARGHAQAIDCLYLDSLDVDFNNPHPSAMHHLMELTSAMPALKCETLVVVDDHKSPEGLPGKSIYVRDHMRTIGAQQLFEGRQIGWILATEERSIITG